MKCACPGREAERSRRRRQKAEGERMKVDRFRHLEQRNNQMMSQNDTLPAIISASRSLTRIEGPRAAVRHAVYTDVQMLEIHSKTAIFCHYSGPSARRPGGSARSARRCRIMRSDMTRARPGHPSTAWRGCTESATSISADCSLSRGVERGR